MAHSNDKIKNFDSTIDVLKLIGLASVTYLIVYILLAIYLPMM